MTDGDEDDDDDDDHPLDLPLPPLQLFSNCCQKQTRLPATFLFPNIEEDDGDDYKLRSLILFNFTRRKKGTCFQGSRPPWDGFLHFPFSLFDFFSTSFDFNIQLCVYYF